MPISDTNLTKEQWALDIRKAEKLENNPRKSHQQRVDEAGERVEAIKRFGPSQEFISV